MTGSPLRRLQELAARARVIGQRLFASDEGGESGGLPVRVQWNTDDVTGIPPNEIRSEQIHGRLPSLDWRHV